MAVDVYRAIAKAITVAVAVYRAIARAIYFYADHTATSAIDFWA